MSKLITINGYDIKVSKKDIINKLEMISNDSQYSGYGGLTSDITNVMCDIAKNSLDNDDYKNVKRVFNISYSVGYLTIINYVSLKSNTNLTECVKALMVICDELLSYGNVEYVDKLLPNYRPDWYIKGQEPISDTIEAEPVHITIGNNTHDLIKSVIELEKVKNSDNVISEKSKEFLKEFNALSKDIIENTVNNIMKTIENAEPVQEVEYIEKNSVFKVGYVYTGSDKVQYFVTNRGLNTIDIVSITKDFREYDVPILTDIYDNEYVNILYSNLVGIISSTDIRWTKDFKSILLDFVNNDFYGNDVYGKYTEEDVKRTLNALYGESID